VGEDHIRASAAERQACGQTDALRTTCDEDSLAAEIVPICQSLQPNTCPYIHDYHTGLAGVDQLAGLARIDGNAMA
jgi:hypothetical protein